MTAATGLNSAFINPDIFTHSQTSSWTPNLADVLCCDSGLTLQKHLLDQMQYRDCFKTKTGKISVSLNLWKFLIWFGYFYSTSEFKDVKLKLWLVCLNWQCSINAMQRNQTDFKIALPIKLEKVTKDVFKIVLCCFWSSLTGHNKFI